MKINSQRPVSLPSVESEGRRPIAKPGLAMREGPDDRFAITPPSDAAALSGASAPGPSQTSRRGGKGPVVGTPAAPPVPREEAIALLKSAGVPDKVLNKAKDSAIQANYQKIKAGLEGGATSIKTKFGKYKVTSTFDKEGALVDVKVKKKGSFLKKALGAVLKIAQFIPGPIGLAARVIGAVQGGVAAIRGGNLLGGLAGALGGIAGAAGGAFGATLTRVSTTLGRVSSAVDAVRNRDLGGLLGAIGGNSPGLTRLTNFVNTAQAIRNRDIGGALSGLGAGIGGRGGERLGQLGNFVSTARNVRSAIRGGDLAGAGAQLLGFASGQATSENSRGRLNDLAGILTAASEVRAANRAGNAELAQLGAEALGQATGQQPVSVNPQEPESFDTQVGEQVGAFFDAEAQPLEAPQG